jgi:hypothetical protein
MSDPTLYCHDYVNQPYPRVRDVLLANPHYLFSRATAAATPHAEALHVHVVGIDVGTEVSIEIVGVEIDCAYDRPATKIALEWRAAHSPRIFPAMKATLVAFARSATETQLELQGAYHPPMGKLGEVIDVAAGYRLAEASVAQLLRQVASWLREELAAPAVVPAVDAKPVRFDSFVDTEC